MAEGDSGRSVGGVMLSGRLVEVEPGREYTDKNSGEKKMGGWRVHLLVGRSVQVVGFGTGDEGGKKVQALVAGKSELTLLTIPVRTPFEGSEFNGYWSAL